jgi:hypothetical protein
MRSSPKPWLIVRRKGKNPITVVAGGYCKLICHGLLDDADLSCLTIRS